MTKFSKLMTFTTFFVLILSCTNKNKSGADLIYLDVSKNYPEKSINLEEIADIKYVQPEFNEDYLFNMAIKHVTSSTITLYDLHTREILFFTIDGKAKSKFNRNGGGPGEYSQISSFIYDEQEDKLFAMTQNSIFVYSSEGHHYYTISLPEGARINGMVNFDKESLLLYNEGKGYNKNFVRISKIDGSVVEEININHKDIDLSFSSTQREGFIVKGRGPTINITRNKEGYLLNDHSNDTIYYYTGNNQLKPALVRTPPIFEMEPYIYINGFIETKDYLFLQKLKTVMENGDLPIDYIMIDKNDHSAYKQKIFIKDYEGKDINLSPERANGSFDAKIGLIELTLEELNEAYADNKLSGNLKELVEASDDDTNNIFMLLYYK